MNRLLMESLREDSELSEGFVAGAMSKTGKLIAPSHLQVRDPRDSATQLVTNIMADRKLAALKQNKKGSLWRKNGKPVAPPKKFDPKEIEKKKKALAATALAAGGATVAATQKESIQESLMGMAAEHGLNAAHKVAKDTYRLARHVGGKGKEMVKSAAKKTKVFLVGEDRVKLPRNPNKPPLTAEQIAYRKKKNAPAKLDNSVGIPLAAGAGMASMGDSKDG